MITYDQIAQACFDNDSMADEGHTLPAIIGSFGVVPADALRAAEQRALRMVLVERGPETAQRMKDQAYAKQFTVEQLDSREQVKLTLYLNMWLDGFCGAAKVITQHG